MGEDGEKKNNFLSVWFSDKCRRMFRFSYAIVYVVKSVHSFLVKYVDHTSLSNSMLKLVQIELKYMLFVRSQQCCGQSAPAGHIGAASAAGPSADLPLSRATGFPASRETGSGPAVPAHAAA